MSHLQFTGLTGSSKTAGSGEVVDDVRQNKAKGPSSLISNTIKTDVAKSVLGYLSDSQSRQRRGAEYLHEFLDETINTCIATPDKAGSFPLPFPQQRVDDLDTIIKGQVPTLIREIHDKDVVICHGLGSKYLLLETVLAELPQYTAITVEGFNPTVKLRQAFVTICHFMCQDVKETATNQSAFDTVESYIFDNEEALETVLVVLHSADRLLLDSLLRDGLLPLVSKYHLKHQTRRSKLKLLLSMDSIFWESQLVLWKFDVMINADRVAYVPLNTNLDFRREIITYLTYSETLSHGDRILADFLIPDVDTKTADDEDELQRDSEKSSLASDEDSFVEIDDDDSESRDVIVSDNEESEDEDDEPEEEPVLQERMEEEPTKMIEVDPLPDAIKEKPTRRRGRPGKEEIEVRISGAHLNDEPSLVKHARPKEITAETWFEGLLETSSPNQLLSLKELLALFVKEGEQITRPSRVKITKPKNRKYQHWIRTAKDSGVSG